MWLQLKLCIMAVAIIHASTITKLDSGVLLTPLSTAQLEKEEWNIVVTMLNPLREYQGFLEPLWDKVQIIYSTLESNGLTDVRIFKTRILQLQRAPRTKRGLINAVGELSKSLFGTATHKDLVKVRDTVNQLITNEERIVTDIKTFTVCLNETQKQQIEISTKVNVLIRHLDTLQNDFEELSKTVKDIEQRLLNTEIGLLLEACLSLLESNYHEQQLASLVFQGAKDQTYIGHLTETLLPKSKLQELLLPTRTHLDIDWYYQNCQVQMMHLNDELFAYLLKISVPEPEVFRQWVITAIPVPQGDAFVLVQPELSGIVSVGEDSGRLFQSNQCTGKDPEVCSGPIVYEKPMMPCLRGVLNNDYALKSACKQEVIAFQQDVIVRVSPGSVVLSTAGEAIELRCPGARPDSLQIIRGAYIITVNPGCTLESNVGWSVQSPAVTHKQVNVSASFIPIEIPSIVIPTGMIVRNYNYTYLEELSGKVYRALPDMNWYRKLNYVQLTGSITGYICFLFICIGIIIAVVLYKYKYKNKPRRKQKPCIGTQDNAPVSKDAVQLKSFCPALATTGSITGV